MNYRAPQLLLTRRRIIAALLTAMAADGLQLLTGPLKFALADQMIDLAAMILVSVTIGFHPFFLPTFIAEFLPVVGMFPTWTGCVVVVLMRRWKAQQYTRRPPVPTDPKVIDV